MNRTITFTLVDKRQVVITPPRETAEETLADLTESIERGVTITLNDPSGSKTVLNPRHIITVELR